MALGEAYRQICPYLKTEDVMVGWKNYTKGRYIICTFDQILLG